MKKPETVNRIRRRMPLLNSLLYDLNLLPEVLATFGQGKDSKEYFYMLSIVNHFALLEHQLKRKKCDFQEIVDIG